MSVSKQVVPDTRWGQAVQEILKNEVISYRDLAVAVGLNKVVSWQYLMGRRNPRPETVKQFNCALAKLVNDERVARYLDSVYAAEFGSVDEESDQFAVEGLVYALGRLLGRYLKKDATPEIASAIESLPEKKRLSLIHEVNEAWRLGIVHEFRKTKKPTTDFDRIYKIFLKYGIDLGRWRRGGKYPYHYRIEHSGEVFELLIRRALAEVADDPTRRRTVEARLVSQFREVYEFVSQEAIKRFEEVEEMQIKANDLKMLEETPLKSIDAVLQS